MRDFRIPTGLVGVLACCAAALAGPAAADDSLNGHYQAAVDGSRSHPLGGILILNTSCNPAGNCTGWVSTPKTWGAPIDKAPGGSWTISRADSSAWTCPDGSKAAADLVYAFSSTSLAGSITSTKAAGGCGDPATPTTTYSLQVQKCVDSPSRGVCP
ncbi:hypothetical protein [Mycobacterium vicinigordonae]|uniref:Secreted protein n=1 Tax=Mycobacterium vicinigordonae TaxID=1719132 RepID=A0A7D6DVR6_9MYCO|nr:hypothetical protein [Mycobacterium vicinigordonae]QLL05927.1 hypothetical protein H0P51_19305 [Mycobacterium vicinigordonae]